MKITKSTQINFYIFIFCLSGFSGLIYESIWSHYLKLFLGHAAYAQTLVLAIFMGGMAIGAWLCSRYSLRWKNLLLIYVIIELGIGCLALIFHPTFIQLLEFSYQTALPQIENIYAINLYKWSLSALVILPQSILLGMTFPLMSAGLIRMNPKKSGSLIAILYFANSLGAAFGVLFSGYFLIKILGLPGTILCAGIINLLIALLVWLSIKITKQRTLASQQAKEKITPVHTPINTQWIKLLLLTALLTGCASFIYEIAWIRMLSLVLGSSTHAFELMLSVFIFGLALGGYWIKKRIDHIKVPMRTLANLQIIMGISALLTLPFYNYTFEFMQLTINTLAKTNSGYVAFNISSLILCLIMLPATFCAGMTLPLISHALIKSHYGEKSIGQVYAFNTIGAIIGVFAATHFIMPLFGLKQLVIFGAAIDITLGIILLKKLTTKKIQLLIKPIFICGVISIPMIAIFIQLDTYKMASGVYRHGNILKQQESKILYHKDGKTSSVDLIQIGRTHLSIANNGKSDAYVNLPLELPGTADEATMVLLSVGPMLHNPNAKNIAVIGMGSGLSSALFLKFPTIQSVDTIEIEQAVIEGAKYFGERVKPVYTDPRSKIIIEDAKSYFASSNKKYDIILSEPSNPWVSGVAGLFSKEYYQLISNYLNKDGLLVQWIQLYEIDLRLVASIFKAINTGFLDYRIYMADNANIVIIASNQKIKKADYSLIFTNAKLKTELHRVSIKAPQDLKIRLLAKKQTLSPLFSLIPTHANSDFFPVLDQNAAKARFLGKNAHKLIALSQSSLPLLEMLSIKKEETIKPNITPTSYLAKSNFSHRAMLIYNYLINVNTPTTIANGYAAGIEYIKLYLQQCNSVAKSNSLLYGFQTLAVSTNNYLPPTLTIKLWQQIKSSPCHNQLDLKMKQLISLSAAIANRNADLMASVSAAMLRLSYYQSKKWKNYLIKVNLLANLADNKPTLAYQLFKQLNFSSESINKLWQTDIELTLLLAHTLKKYKEHLTSKKH